MSESFESAHLRNLNHIAGELRSVDVLRTTPENIRIDLGRLADELSAVAAALRGDVEAAEKVRRLEELAARLEVDTELVAWCSSADGTEWYATTGNDPSTLPLARDDPLDALLAALEAAASEKPTPLKVCQASGGCHHNPPQTRGCRCPGPACPCREGEPYCGSDGRPGCGHYAPGHPLCHCPVTGCPCQTIWPEEGGGDA